MLSLNTCLEQLANWKKSVTTTLTAKKNLYYYKSGIVAVALKATGYLVLSGLPKGVYLVVGSVVSKVSYTNALVISSVSTPTSTASVIAGGFVARTTADAGGGVTPWAIIKATANNTSVRVSSYGNGWSSGTSNYSMAIAAIKLINS